MHLFDFELNALNKMCNSLLAWRAWCAILRKDIINIWQWYNQPFSIHLIYQFIQIWIRVFFLIPFSNHDLVYLLRMDNGLKRLQMTQKDRVTKCNKSCVAHPWQIFFRTNKGDSSLFFWWDASNILYFFKTKTSSACAL